MADGHDSGFLDAGSILFKEFKNALESDFMVGNRLFQLVLLALVLMLVMTV